MKIEADWKDLLEIILRLIWKPSRKKKKVRIVYEIREERERERDYSTSVLDKVDRKSEGVSK